MVDLTNLQESKIDALESAWELELEKELGDTYGQIMYRHEFIDLVNWGGLIDHDG